ncbi:glycosyltransferase family 2 protein [Euzebya rosea]|uniref:glycosyltransferase family 2 protein n=1 Tax=Euzebya rosea TaxID=2052804 RepID=UPI0013008357|nr:glycosyltransferase [Euzebya rosea]
MRTPSATVVVCAHTTERIGVLGQALRSLDAQTRPPDQVVLVIDHNEALMTYARLAWPALDIVAADDPAGLSAARNTGLAVARHDIVAFLDDDAEADPAWLQRIGAAFADPTVQAVGGRAVPQWPGERPRWFHPTFDWVVGCTHEGSPTTPARVRNVIGCSMAFRASALAALGGFDTGVGRGAADALGAEETELCIRLRRLLGPDSVLFDPTIQVRHHVDGDRARMRYYLRRCHGEGRSKARVASTQGPDDALSSERAHLRATLPAALGRCLGTPAGLRNGGPAQAAAIVAGVLAAAAGYATEHQRLARQDRLPRHEEAIA